MKLKRNQLGHIGYDGPGSDERPWFKHGLPMEIDPAELREFQFIGLSNVDFLTYEITSEQQTGNVAIVGIKL